jgi:hypothetical protein
MNGIIVIAFTLTLTHVGNLSREYLDDQADNPQAILRASPYSYDYSIAARHGLSSGQTGEHGIIPLLL